MSYSFNVQAATKADASKAVADKLAEVVASQPVHEIDQEQAQATADAFIDLIADDDSRDITVAVHGSVYSTDKGLQNASVGVSVGLVLKAE